MDEKDRNSTLTARQEKVIAAVLEARNIREGLTRAKVSPSVFYSWMRGDEAFREELERKRKELTAEGWHMLKAAVLEATQTVIEILKSKESDTVRLRAAESILDRVTKLNIEERLAVLERSLNK